LSELNINGCVIDEPRQGKANAVKNAMQRVNPLFWIMTDADATYSPETLSQLLKSMIKLRNDHGVADRISDNAYTNSSRLKTYLHKLGNIYFTKIIEITTGAKYRDVLSGGRVFSAPFINSISISSDGFQLESELNIKSAELGIRTIEIPTTYGKRADSNPSKLSTFKDGFKILRFIVSNAFFEKPDKLFFLVAFLSFLPGFFLAVKLIFIYIEIGSVQHTSTAVAVALLLIVSVQLFLFSLYINFQRKERIQLNIKEFSMHKRSWNAELDRILGNN